MSDLTKAIARVDGEHAIALNWFHEHTGQTVAWSDTRQFADLDEGARLVNQAKGIYRPHYTDYIP